MNDARDRSAAKWLIAGTLALLLMAAGAIWLVSQAAPRPIVSPLLGCWKNGEILLDFRNDGTLRYKVLGDPKVETSRWQMTDSQLVLKRSRRNFATSLIARLTGARSDTESHPIISISESAIVIGTPRGNRTMIRLVDWNQAESEPAKGE